MKIRGIVGNFVLLLLCVIFFSGCSLMGEIEAFSEEDFLAELEEQVALQNDEIVMYFQNSDDIDNDVKTAIDAAYQRYIIGENVENIAWSIQKFVHTRITLEIEYRDSLVDARENAVEYSADGFYQILYHAVLKKENVEVLLKNDGILTDEFLEDAIRNVLFENTSAVVNYYVDRAQYAIHAYDDYARVKIDLVYLENTVDFENLPIPADPSQAIALVAEQWDDRETAVLYYPEGVENATDFCKMLVNSATANDVDDPYLCGSCEWTIYGEGEDSCIFALRKISDYDAEKHAEQREILLEEAQSIADSLTETDPEQQLREIGKLLTRRIKYDDDLANEIKNHTDALSHEANLRRTAYGALMEGETVCSGYARAFKLLCDLTDLDCWVIDGTVDGEGHEWNMVCIDGKVYYVDLTFADTGNAAKYYLFGESLYQKEGYIADEFFYVPGEEVVSPAA